MSWTPKPGSGGTGGGLTESLKQPPVPAQYDEVNKAVVPDIHGFEIDIVGTVEKIRSARKGANIIPVWRDVPAEKRLADFMELPIYQGNPLKRQVSLVVNVSWGNEYLEEILDILAQEKAAASFCGGPWAGPTPVGSAHPRPGRPGQSRLFDPHMQDLVRKR